jgi:RNA polymerase sigma-70 factor (ECF subfamily)
MAEPENGARVAEDDVRCFEAWCAGDRAAGAVLFDRYYDHVARYFHNKVPEAVRVDLIQSTLLGCVEARERFRRDAAFRTFLLSVARNVLHKYYRTQAGPRGRVDFGEVTAADLGPTASEVVRAKQERKLLLESLRRVPVECQEVLELLYWEQLSVAEIAGIVDTPVGTIKSRLRRGRRLLQEQIERLAENPTLLASTLGGLDRWAAEVRDNIRRQRVQ